MMATLFSPTFIIRIRCLLVALLLSALLSACASSSINRSSFEPVNTEGISLSPKPPASEDQLINLSAEVLLAKGRVHLSQGNLSLAKIHFLLSIKKAPEELPAYVELARTLEQEMDYDKATNVYGTILKKNPDNLPALIGQGRLKRQQGHAEEALAMLMQVNNIAPTNAVGLNELAITLDSLGKEQLAEKYYLALIGLRPDQPAAYNNLGFNYLLQKRYTKAISNFNLASVKDPQNKLYQFNLATAYALNGQEKEAMKLFEHVLDTAAAYNNLGYIYMTQGRSAEAKDALQNALALNPVYYVRAQENLKQVSSKEIETKQ